MIYIFIHTRYDLGLPLRPILVSPGEAGITTRSPTTTTSTSTTASWLWVKGFMGTARVRRKTPWPKGTANTHVFIIKGNIDNAIEIKPNEHFGPSLFWCPSVLSPAPILESKFPIQPSCLEAEETGGTTTGWGGGVGHWSQSSAWCSLGSACKKRHRMTLTVLLC